MCINTLLLLTSRQQLPSHHTTHYNYHFVAYYLLLCIMTHHSKQYGIDTYSFLHDFLGLDLLVSRTVTANINCFLIFSFFFFSKIQFFLNSKNLFQSNKNNSDRYQPLHHTNTNVNNTKRTCLQTKTYPQLKSMHFTNSHYITLKYYHLA